MLLTARATSIQLYPKGRPNVDPDRGYEEGSSTPNNQPAEMAETPSAPAFVQRNRGLCRRRLVVL